MIAACGCISLSVRSDSQHDDGSNNFLDTENVVAFAGMKNYLGFAKQTSGNLFVRPDFVGPSWNPTGEQPGLPGVPVPRPHYFPFCARSLGQEQWYELADTFENNVRSPYNKECTALAFQVPDNF